MFKRILVPTDGSASSAIGVRYAVALAQERGAKLLGLHVVDVKLLEGPFLRDLFVPQKGIKLLIVEVFKVNLMAVFLQAGHRLPGNGMVKALPVRVGQND